VRIVRVFQPILLQGTEVIRVPDLRTELVENVPVPLLPFWADLPLEMAHHVADDPIVIEQRVIDVEQKNDGARRGH
jgi:hypothetical protein